MLEQANFTYSPFEKALKKQTKSTEDQEETQTKNFEFSNKINELKQIEGVLLYNQSTNLIKGRLQESI